MEWVRLKAWLLLMYATILVQGYRSRACFQEEKTALLNFKEFLRPHTKSVDHAFRSWVHNPKSDCCEWERVTCDSASGHVIHLSLEFLYAEYDHGSVSYNCINYSSLNFSLLLPFKELRSLNLSFNCFDGWILTQDEGGMSALKRLETIDLSGCAFDLSIVEPLSALTSLKTLLLADNNMDGSFPVQELLALQNLEQLDLSGNRLGNLSTTQDFKSMSALKKLETLDLSKNDFEETSNKMFEALSALKSLKKLLLSGIKVRGPCPVQELSALQHLEMLDLSRNSLTSRSKSQGTWQLCAFLPVHALRALIGPFKLCRN